MKISILILSVTIIVLLFLISGIFLFKTFVSNKVASTKQPISPTTVQSNGKTKVKYPQDYTLVLVGDSMTQLMGNSDELREFLKKYYPGKTFEVLNYGFGSTNILSLPKRLTEKTFYTREFRPITEIDFDLILIESFGHNPLSEYSLEEGLKKQTDTLSETLKILKRENPNAKIMFVATLAPSKKNYARNQVDLSDAQRAKWAEERIAYIKNHIQFAKANNIPVVNIFEKSLTEEGDVNLDYISKDDFIHPSPSGIVFISQQLADFIFENKILE